MEDFDIWPCHWVSTSKPQNKKGMIWVIILNSSKDGILTNNFLDTKEGHQCITLSYVCKYIQWLRRTLGFNYLMEFVKSSLFVHPWPRFSLSCSLTTHVRCYSLVITELVLELHHWPVWASLHLLVFLWLTWTRFFVLDLPGQLLWCHF